MELVFFFIIIGVGVITFFFFKQKEKKEREIKADYLEKLNKVTTSDRGTSLERQLVVHLQQEGISPMVIFHDLYAEKSNGSYAQIDLVVVTSQGLIVIEVKDYVGWIFGNGHRQKWTQVLSYGQDKYSFYNPIIQNANHIKALKRQSFQFYKLPYFSVIVFSNECELRDISFIPENTFVTKAGRLIDVIYYIKRNYPAANYSNKQEVIDILKQCVSNGTPEMQEKHIRNIQEMLGNERLFN